MGHGPTALHCQNTNTVTSGAMWVWSHYQCEFFPALAFLRSSLSHTCTHQGPRVVRTGTQTEKKYGCPLLKAMKNVHKSDIWAGSHGLLPGLAPGHRYPKPQNITHTAFPGHKQGTGSEVEQSGHKPYGMLELAGRVLVCCTMVPAPFSFLLMLLLHPINHWNNVILTTILLHWDGRQPIDWPGPIPLNRVQPRTVHLQVFIGAAYDSLL